MILFALLPSTAIYALPPIFVPSGIDTFRSATWLSRKNAGDQLELFEDAITPCFHSTFILPAIVASIANALILIGFHCPLIVYSTLPETFVLYTPWNDAFAPENLPFPSLPTVAIISFTVPLYVTAIPYSSPIVVL